ncbi:MAG TPA: MFS transporter [Verrucomicrobiales bacterium]|nr:MFS transporter [Verrucomicrobiales bacterium]
MTIEERERHTFRLERWRAVGTGVLETSGATFLVLIAERWFSAGPAAKSLLLASGSIGLLLTPLVLMWAGKRAESAGNSASVLYLVAAAVLSATLAANKTVALYVTGCVIGFIFVTSVNPLFATIYQANYRADRRGDLFSRNIVIRILANVVFAFAAGKLLEYDISWWRAIIGAYAVALIGGAVCLRRSPPAPVHTSEGTHPLRAFRHVRDDRVFRWTLVSWMLMGFANLVMYALRVEYLVSTDYGIQEDALTVAMLTAIAPNLARLVFTRIWGRLFDRMKFNTLRIILNFCVMLGILSFFTGAGLTGLYIGAILFGISNAGADLAWSLWVTKVAPPALTTEYMTVHTFLTGIRGIIAPFAAFYMAPRLGIGVTAVSMAVLILLGSAVLVQERAR